MTSMDGHSAETEEPKEGTLAHMPSTSLPRPLKYASRNAKSRLVALANASGIGHGAGTSNCRQAGRSTAHTETQTESVLLPATIPSLFRLRRNKLGGFLVDGVVGEVHEPE